VSSLRNALLVAAPVVAVDQVSKQVVLALLENRADARLAVVPGFFNLVEVWNTGVSFGMLGNSGLSPWLLTGVSLAICVGLGWWLWRGRAWLASVAVGLVIGGAIGNVVDRLRWGGVFDFADFHLGHWHWPAFNAADAAIVIGVGVLLFDSVFLEKRHSA